MSKAYELTKAEGWRVSRPFKLLTSKSVLDIADSDHYSEDVEALFDEQIAVLESLGYDYWIDYITVFGNRNTEGFYSMDEAVQMLALKDGCDLVEFDNGHIGFVGYYNGFNDNYCYFVDYCQLSEHCLQSKTNSNEIYVIDDDLIWLYVIKNESEIESAVDLIEWSISAWYNTEDYPEYESICIGDVIDEQLDDKCIEYEYISIGK